jgi:hypothetical protein
MRTMFEDLDEYSYRAGDADVEADDRFESMILLRGDFIVGLVSAYRPDVAARLWGNLERTSQEFDGFEFQKHAMVHLGRAIGESLWGRRIPGTSVDYGEGMGAILGHGRDPASSEEGAE